MKQALRERIDILALSLDGGGYQWAVNSSSRAHVEWTGRSSIYSALGLSSRGIKLTLRNRSGLTLHHAIRLSDGTHIFLNRITPCDNRVYMEVEGAVVQVSKLDTVPKDGEPKVTFPAVVTQKYARHENEGPYATNDVGLVLVTPKVINLTAGYLVVMEGQYYEILTAHRLDPYKNEFEIRRRWDL